MTRQDIRHMGVLALAILTVVLVGAFGDGIDRMLRDLTRPDGPSGTKSVPVSGADLTGVASVTDGDTLEIRGARIRRRPITCIKRDTDRYGRLVAVCHQGAIDLNLWMVANGHALAYRRYSTDYMAQEDMARQHKRGLWAGNFVAPWDWRKADTSSPARATGCTIKGNISRSGARIYHVPGQRHYQQTRISESKGERWFCSEAEARAAGWRRARQ